MSQIQTKCHRSSLSLYKAALSVTSGILLANGSWALTPIGEEQGWSGYVLAGLAHTEVKSNTVVGNDLIDGGKKTIGSIYDKPRNNADTHALAGTEIRYTLPNRNQLFLGGSLEDRLTLDFATQFGWRKQTSEMGIFQLGYLFSGIPVEVWEDPYLSGTPRKSTDRDSQGIRFVWGRIMGSPFELTLQARETDINDEFSGSDPAVPPDYSIALIL